MSIPAGSKLLIPYRIPGTGENGEASFEEMLEASIGSVAGAAPVRDATRGWIGTNPITTGNMDAAFGPTRGTVPQKGASNWAVASGFPYDLNFSVSGTLSVANDVSPWVILPANQIKGLVISAVCKTAPVGADLQFDIKYNVAVDSGGTWITVATVNNGGVFAIANTQHASGLFAPTVVNYSAGFAFRLDILQVGVSVAGADLKVTMLCNVGQ